jgi:nanoRNase/pAp phosphatase (c-di-AMP/oligoRNAs hydrolase)/CBS domain-containing protein
MNMMHIVTTHKNTDFDGLASVMAAKILYPDAISVLPKQINPNVKAFLSIHKEIFDIYSSDQIALNETEKLIVVDTNRWERLDGMQRLKAANGLKIYLWDHHPEKGNIQATWMCNEATGAAITLLIRQLKKKQKTITPFEATLFLAGLYEDTGNLTFLSTTAEDAHAAGYLLDKKADLSLVTSFLRPVYGEKQKNILFDMLQKAGRSKVNGYTLSISQIEISGHVANLAVVVQMYREILNVDAAFGIFTDSSGNRCMVIGRGKADTLDIGSIMRGLGGGGHPGAGSAMLKNANPGTVMDLIIGLIKGNQRSSVPISDIMSFPVFTVDVDTTMEAAAILLREKGCTGVPVLENESVVGIISRRDFRKIKKETQLAAPVKAYMSQKVITIGPDKNPMQAARLMVKHDIGRLPVVHKGRVIGIVTRSDSMRYFYDQLPD